MKKAILPLVLCMLSLSFCTKDDPTPPTPTPTPFCHQTSATVDYVSATANNHYQVNYTFNDDHKLTGEGSALTYEWSTNQMIKRSFLGGAVQYRTTYVLDNAGRAVSQTTTDGAGNYDNNETFEYDAAGYLVKIIKAGNFASTTTQEWSQGNLVKVISISQFGDVVMGTSTYDPNLIRPASFTRLPIFGRESKNLPISDESVYSFGSSTYTSQFELDTRGNVVKHISNGVNLGQTSMLTTVYTYEGCQ